MKKKKIKDKILRLCTSVTFWFGFFYIFCGLEVKNQNIFNGLILLYIANLKMDIEKLEEEKEKKLGKKT